MNRSNRLGRGRALLRCAALGGVALLALGLRPDASHAQIVPRVGTNLVVLAWGELGMHCMNADFSEIMILPPYNTMHAQVLERGHSPDFVTSDVTLNYIIPSNTHSADKTNFWKFAPALLGVTLPPDVGLTGNGLSGTMARSTSRRYTVTGVPIVPIDDSGLDNSYPLATVQVRLNGAVVVQTQTVMPVSTEMACYICHGGPDISVASDILQKHDLLHGTTLSTQKPVFCASCHADPAVGSTGQPGVSNLSHAMHNAHAQRVAPGESGCYMCHPGYRTQCQRDVHFLNGVGCTQCHGDMVAVADPTRQPWASEPRCGDCHARPGFEFEQPGVLFRESVGHSGVQCAACHGSPHAIAPTATAVDNVQALTRQGHAGKIDTCTVCHTAQPSEPFFHRRGDD